MNASRTILHNILTMGGGPGGKALGGGGGGFNNTFGGEGCFVAGTLVLTQQGHIPIEQIKQGELVWSENVETGEIALKQVTKTTYNLKSTLVNIHFDDILITTTEGHPFWVQDYGWQFACELSKCTSLRSKTGPTVSTENVVTAEQEQPITVHNIEVADWHTYYISQLNVLVHNASSQGPIKGHSKAKDAHHYGNPGQINRTGYKETFIGHDGRARVERHHSHHSTPNKHSNPHDHIIKWRKDGSPKYGKQINYFDKKPPRLGQTKTSRRKKQESKAKKLVK